MTTPNSGDENLKPGTSPQDPPGGETPPATPAPEANKPGAQGDPPANEDQTVPIRALHEEREKRQTLQASNQALSEQVDQLRGVLANKPENNAPSNEAATTVRRDLDELWETDPRKATQTEIKYALDWFDRQNEQMAAQEDEVAGKFTDFNDYRKEVRAYLRKLPPQDRGKPGVVELAYYASKGQKTDAIVESRTQEILRKIKAGESVQGLAGTTSASSQPVSTQATEEQVKVAAAMNMSTEEYLSHIKK